MLGVIEEGMSGQADQCGLVGAPEPTCAYACPERQCAMVPLESSYARLG